MICVPLYLQVWNMRKSEQSSEYRILGRFFLQYFVVVVILSHFSFLTSILVITFFFYRRLFL